MERVVPDLYRIELSGVNAYLWTGAGGPTLIDTGMPGSLDTLIKEMASVGVAPGDLQRIIITHADLDHVGGLPKLKAQSGAAVVCHAAEDAYVRGHKVKGPGGRLGALLRPIYRLIVRFYWSGIHDVDEVVIEGRVLPEGFTVLHMPGHAPGQIALWHEERGILITADALNNRRGKLGAPPPLFTPNMAAAHESITKLRKYKFETACFGHGPPILSGADSAIAAFSQSLGDS